MNLRAVLVVCVLTQTHVCFCAPLGVVILLIIIVLAIVSAAACLLIRRKERVSTVFD